MYVQYDKRWQAEALPQRQAITAGQPGYEQRDNRSMRNDRYDFILLGFHSNLNCFSKPCKRLPGCLLSKHEQVGLFKEFLNHRFKFTLFVIWRRTSIMFLQAIDSLNSQAETFS